MRCFLALSLLDSVVINCGYPAHLMVSKKDFLNRLVYRFPPQPDDTLDRCHYLIMSLIKKWSEALCQRSRYRDDFGNIRMMLALLKAKGFPVPEVEPSAIDAIAGLEGPSLQTKEQLEAEERLVNETRLDELLHRGQPADLVAANALMKKLVGYSAKEENGGIEYNTAEARIDHELNLLADKIDLLESMKKESPDSEAYKGLYSECKRVVPRMFQLANSELSEAIMMKLLILNQRLNEAVNEDPDDMKNEDLNMDMLIDLEKSCGDVGKPAALETKDIMELYKQSTPKLGPMNAKLEYYTGSSMVLIDLVRMGGSKFLRVFNADQSCELRGVEVAGQMIGVVAPLTTVTVRTDSALDLTVPLRYQRNGQQFHEKLEIAL